VTRSMRECGPWGRTLGPVRQRVVLAWVAASVVVLSACGGGSSTSRSDSSATPRPSETGTAGITTRTAPAPTQVALAPARPGESLVTLTVPGGSYTPSAPNGGTDDYRCFLLDSPQQADSYITGTAFQPGSGLVHHAISYRIQASQVSAAKALDAKSPTPGWTCFGGTGIPSPPNTDPLAALDQAQWLSAWAPGVGESTYPTGSGVRLSRGSHIVLQIHYNLLAGQAVDHSSIRLRLVPATRSIQAVETMLLPAPVELPCAPGEYGVLCQRSWAVADVIKRFGQQAGFTIAGLQVLCGGSLTKPKSGATQTCKRSVPRAVTVYSAAGHMHLLGRKIKIVANAGTARARTLLDNTNWNFDSQGAKSIGAPLHLNAGDHISITCTHDASLRKKLPELAELPSRYVVWGEGTSDEMCLGILLYTRG
jgi:hypothetical protein